MEGFSELQLALCTQVSEVVKNDKGNELAFALTAYFLLCVTGYRTHDTQRNARLDNLDPHWV